MADINVIVKRLEKRKNTDENLAAFSNEMMRSGNRLAYSKFSLNYPVFYEILSQLKEEKAEMPDCITENIDGLNQLIKRYFAASFSGESMEKFIADIDALRQKNSSVTNLLTAYADCYTIYEYVLNRVEYRFKETTPDNTYTDEMFKDKIIEFLTMDHDASVRRMKTVQILEQLPMRMAKSRFMQILRDSLSAYRDSDKVTVDNLIFMIGTSAMMEEPDGFSDLYPDLYKTITTMAQADFSNLTNAQYESLLKQLTAGFQVLNQDMDVCMMIQSLINDMYVIILSDPHAVIRESEKENFKFIIQEVGSYFESDYKKTIDSVIEHLEKLEGIQEECYEQFQTGEAALEEIEESYHDLLEGLMLDKAYYSFRLMSKLFSSSIYMELQDQGQKGEKAGKDYIDKVYRKLSEELKAHLKKQSKNISRAIMAKVLTYLPMFLGSFEELEDYILTSLSSCKDKAEKAACVEIIEGIMKG